MALPCNPLRVLVVDDNEDAAFMICALLATFGYDARSASNGSEALTVSAQLLPHVIFTDLRMAGMSGFDLCKRIRALHGDTVRIVALSAFADAATRATTGAAGFDAHLQKPATIDATIIEICRRPAMSPHPLRRELSER